MTRDITALLRSWPFVMGSIAARRIKGRDGKPKLQLRVDLGVLQMEVVGRPDGKQPLGFPSWVHALQHQLETREDPQRDGTPLLPPEECIKLHQEAMQFHQRSLAFYHLEDMKAAAADSAHNLSLFDLLHNHSSSSGHAWPSLQLTPQQTVLYARARAGCLKPDQHAERNEMLGQLTASLARFFERLGRPEWADACPELGFLRAWHKASVESVPLPEAEQLSRQLADAIHREDYEQAARLRDQLKRLGNG